MRLLSLVLSLVCTTVSAHELWLEPLNFQIESGGTLQANLVNGENFEGTRLAYIPQRFEHFIVRNEGGIASVSGRVGDVPAVNQRTQTDGLHVVAYQARNATVSYETWEKFQKFVDHKDLGDQVRAEHEARNLPLSDFTEVYSRYSKALFGVGDAQGSDARLGLTTELVALTNPYTDDLSQGMQVALFYQGEPRRNEQIEVFERTTSGSVAVFLVRTNDAGVASVPVKRQHSYMLDAVVLREPSSRVAADTGGVWETLWANMTFAVP